MYVKRNYKDDKDMFQTTLENVEMAKQAFEKPMIRTVFVILKV